MPRKTKQSKPAADSPAFINSSYTVFFLIFTVVWAYFLSGYFPTILQPQAFVIMIVFSVMLLVFRYLLLQFYDGVTVLKMLVMYFGLSAVLAFASAVIGPLADGTVPYIHILFLAKLIVFSAPALIVGSVFPFYGAVTLILALWSATIFELIFNAVSKILPKSVLKTLHMVDSKVDKAADAGSAQLYIHQEWKGVIAVILLLAIYAAVYVWVLAT